MSNRPGTGAVLSGLVQGTLAALIGLTLGCDGSSPLQPAPTPVTPFPAVSPAPVTPAPVATAVYTVTAGTAVVAPSGQLSVGWTASTAGGNDWIALFKKSDPNTAHGWWTGWTEGATSGTFVLSAPTQAGQYEFRYLLDDGFNDAATSSLVTVGPSPEPLRTLPK